MDAKRAAADVLYMLGDNSTHSMVIIPKSFENKIRAWLDEMDSIALSAEGKTPEDGTVREFLSPAKRWSECVDQLMFFAEFSPELQKLVLTSRDRVYGIVRADTVNAIRGLFGIKFIILHKYLCDDLRKYACVIINRACCGPPPHT